MDGVGPPGKPGGFFFPLARVARMTSFSSNLPTVLRSWRAPASRVAVVLVGFAAFGSLSAQDAAFARCLDKLRLTKTGRLISDDTWQRAVKPLVPDSSVLVSLNAQPEFTLPVWDYMAVLVDDERINEGLEGLLQHKDVFSRVATRYGVRPEIVAAVWGVESNYGKGIGGQHVLRSLATLSCYGRRQTYFRGEFLAALRIVQAGDIQPEDFKGSWAGAFGQTQFMPSTFLRLAVDFDGDGRRDLMNGTADALASAANYLRNAGWRTGAPWGFEVLVKQNRKAAFSTKGEGRRVRRALTVWAGRGLTRADGSPLISKDLPGATRAALLSPGGPNGPLFLVFQNYNSLYRYNASERYALAIGLIADRLSGVGPKGLVTPWPTDDPGLSREDRRELQRLLSARGHPIGAANAILTARTRAAIIAEQTRLGRPTTGRAGQQLLQLLRDDARR